MPVIFLSGPKRSRAHGRPWGGLRGRREANNGLSYQRDGQHDTPRAPVQYGKASSLSREREVGLNYGVFWAARDGRNIEIQRNGWPQQKRPGL